MSRKRLLCLALLAYVTFLGLAERSTAEQQNITIDDAYPGGDPSVTLIYLPVTGWIEGSVCVSCEAHVDPSQTVDGTWHDASSNTIDSFQRSIEFNFTGYAVYAYFILANNFTSFSTLTNLSFSLDGEEAGTFVHNPSPDPTYEYNVLVYSSSDLENAPHSLNITTSGITPSVLLFDYFNYTVDTAFSVASGGSVSTPTSTSTSSVASSSNIILSVGPSATDRSTGNTTKLPRAQALLHGLVAVTIVTILIILFLLILLLKRRRRLNLYRCCRNYRRDKPRTQDMTRTTVIDPFPNVIPATGNLLAPADYSVDQPPSAPAEKRRPVQVSEMQHKMETLHTGQAGDFASTERATIRAPEGVLSIRDADDILVPRITKQIAALRDQIRHWERQLATGSRLAS